MARRRMQAGTDAGTDVASDEAERSMEHSVEHMASVMPKATDLWLETQSKLFEHVDEVARRWLDRRREALDATKHSMEEMRRSSDVGDLMRIQQEWVVGVMRRMTADITELTGAALTFTQSSASRIGQAGESMAYDMERAGHEALSAAGSKPRHRSEEDGE